MGFKIRPIVCFVQKENIFKPDNCYFMPQRLNHLAPGYSYEKQGIMAIVSKETVAASVGN